MTKPMTFEEWFAKEFGEAYDPTEGMGLAWQACEAQQAQHIKELTELLDFMERHTAIYPAHPKRVKARELLQAISKGE